MKKFFLLLKKETRNTFSFRGNYILCLIFYMAILFLLPLGIGPEKELLSNISPGLIWVSMILVCFLSLENIFYEDFNDGTLDLYLIGDLSLYQISFAKSFSHWLSNCLPIVILTPIFGIFVSLPNEIIFPTMITLFIGSPALSFIGCMGASMSLSSRWHGLILPIIILPLFLPVLIFGAGSLSTLIFNGFEEVYIRQLFVLAGLSGLAIVFCPIISAYVIKVNFE